jgi:hypothetical protein
MRISCIKRFPFAFPAIFLILFLRNPDLLNNAQLWAEDGSVFLTDGITLPFVDTLLKPYAGYFHLFPRLIAGLFTNINLLFAPLVFNIAALLVMSFSMWLLLTDMFEEFLPLSYRGIIVIILCLMPWHSETYGSVTNSHWYFFYCLALLSFGDLNKANAFGKILLPFFLLISIFTSPNAVLVTPILTARIVQSYNKRDYAFYITTMMLSLILISIVAVKMVIPSNNFLPQGNVIDSLVFLLKGIGFKTFAFSIFGEAYATQYMKSAIYYGLFSLILLSMVLLYYYKTCGKIKSIGCTGAMILPYFIISPIILTALLRPNYVVHFATNDLFEGADRYFIIPSFFLAIFFAQCAYAFKIHLRVSWLMKIVPVGFYLVVLAVNFQYPPRTDFCWREHVRLYYEKLLSTNKNNYSEQTYFIPVPPRYPWGVHVPLFLPSNYDIANLRKRVKLLSEINLLREVEWQDLKRVDGGLMNIDSINERLYSSFREKVTVDSSKDESMLIKGWAVDDKNKNPGDKVYLVFRSNNAEIIVPTRREKRKDVAKHFNEGGYKRSGWASTFKTDNFQKRCYSLSARILQDNKKQYYELDGGKPICF